MNKQEPISGFGSMPQHDFSDSINSQDTFGSVVLNVKGVVCMQNDNRSKAVQSRYHMLNATVTLRYVSIMSGVLQVTRCTGSISSARLSDSGPS